MSFLRLLLFAFATLGVLNPSMSLAQQSDSEQMGHPQGAAFARFRVDSVNAATGNVVVHIPLFDLPQKGRLQLSTSAILNTNTWQAKGDCSGYENANCTFYYYTKARSTRQGPDSTQLGPTIVWDQNYFPFIAAEVQGGNNAGSVISTLYSVGDAEGGEHPLFYDAADPTKLRTADGSRLLFQPQSSHPYNYAEATSLGTLIGPNGNKYVNDGSTVSVTDVDGNSMTLSPTLSDSVGRSFSPFSNPSLYDPISSSTTGCPNLSSQGIFQPANGSIDWSVPGYSGTVTYKVCYSTFHIHTNFWDHNGQSYFTQIPAPDCGDFYAACDFYQFFQEHDEDVRVIHSIVLPDGTYWGFLYDASDPSSSTSYGYGTLKKLIYPSGGSITYAYSMQETCNWGLISNYAGINVWSSQHLVSRTESDGNGHSYTTTYTRDPDTGSMIETDFAGNDSVFTFEGDGSASCKATLEHSRSTYQGGRTVNKLLRTVTTTHELQLPPTTHFFPGSGSAASINTQIVSVVTDGIQESTTTYGYGGTFQAVQFDCGTSCVQGTPVTLTLAGPTYQSTTAADETRSSSTSFWYANHPTYAAANLLDLPESHTLTSNDVEVAKTTYVYDEATYYPAAKIAGHATSVTRHNDNGTSPVTHTSWNSSGLVDHTVDARGITDSTYTYGSTQSLYPTIIADALHSTIYTYDFNTGLPLSQKDPNQALTSYTYEAGGRLTDLTKADGGETTYCYSLPSALGGQSAIPAGCTTGASNSVRSRDKQNGSVWQTQEQDFDGLGRVFASKNVISAGSTILQEQDLNGRDQVLSSSNPHDSTAASSGNVTFVYDALGRPIVKTDQDGNQQNWCYDNKPIDNVHQTSCSARIDSTASGTWTDSSDEAGLRKQTVSNGFGAIAKVVERGTSAAPLAWLTSYGYTGRGDLQSVTQSGAPARTRSFNYDSLSRLLQEYNPESGWTCYGTVPSGTVPNGSNCTYGYDVNGNLLAKTDARGKEISYSYDSLNRLTYKSASDSTSANNSSANHYTYDQVFTGWGMPHYNTIGRLMRSESCNANGCNDDTFSYDIMGRIDHIESASPSEAGQAHVVASQYDLAGNETQTYYGHRDNGDLGGITIGRTYDSAGRMSSVFQKARNGIPLSTPYNLVSSVTYLPNGSPNVINYGNGTTETIWQNSRQQVCESGLDDSITTFFRRRYFYNSGTSSGDACSTVMSGNNGNIWHILDATTTSGNSPYTQDFTYDSLNRVTSWTAQYATGGPRTQAFNYDSFGNLQQTKGYSEYPQQTGTPDARLFPNPGWTNVSDWPYDTKNRLKSGTFDCTTAQAGDPSHPWYDVAGNVLCGGSNSDMNGQQYLWDAESRIKQLNAEHYNNTYTKQATYVYDGEGNRVNAVQYDAGGNAVSFRDSIRYQGSILWDENGGPGMSNTWNDYVYAFGKRIARVDASAPVLHLRGMRDTGVAAWGVEGPVNGLATNIVGKVIQPGDFLVIDERQDMVTYGGLTLFTRDSSGNVICACEAADTVTAAPTFFNSFSDGRWHHFSADLSAHAGETIYYVVAGIHNSAPPTGTFDLRLANAVLLHADGSVDPLFSPSTTVTNFQPNFYGGAAALSSGVSPDTVQGATASSPGTVSIRFTNDGITDSGDRNLFITGLTAGGQAVDLSGATYTSCHDGPGIYCGGSMTVSVPNSETLQISAYGSLSNGVGPHMMVYFNGVLAAQWDVPTVNTTFTMQPPIVPNPMAVTYYVSDQVGTAQMEFSAFGGPKWKGEFAPFGQELDTQPTASRFKFTGGERDVESGLDYFGARSYMSSSGRFISPDPSGLAYADPSNPQSLNLYSYAQNNPIRNTDPTGFYCYYDPNPGQDPNDSSLFDMHSSTGECNETQGHWIDDPSTTVNVNANGDGSIDSYSSSFDGTTVSLYDQHFAWKGDPDVQRIDALVSIAWFKPTAFRR